jgi:hypothetical protein
MSEAKEYAYEIPRATGVATGTAVTIRDSPLDTSKVETKTKRTPAPKTLSEPASRTLPASDEPKKTPTATASGIPREVVCKKPTKPVITLSLSLSNFF